MKVTLCIDSKKPIEIEHSDLATIVSCLSNDRRNGIFFSPLFDHPASEVRSAVAGLSFFPLDELECLSRDTSIDVVRQVANNKRALKMFETPLFLKMISRDVSVAADIVDNLNRVRDSARDDVIEVLLQHTDPKIVEATQSFVDDNVEVTWEDDPIEVDDPD